VMENEVIRQIKGLPGGPSEKTASAPQDVPALTSIQLWVGAGSSNTNLNQMGPPVAAGHWRDGSLIL